MIPAVQYISQSDSTGSHYDHIQSLCEMGIRWVQLRMKDMHYEDMYELACRCRDLTRRFDCCLIINDHIDVARASDADGVHLGKRDAPRTAAREVLGNKIIGATANTLEEVLLIHSEGVADYIGLGPYRFTTTKKELSPLLGLEGYRRIIDQLKKENLKIPLIAIGGIRGEDLKPLLELGLAGVAVSSALHQDPGPFVAYFQTIQSSL